VAAPSRYPSRCFRLIWLGGVLAASPLPAQDPPKPDRHALIEALRQFIPRVMKLEGTPGLNLAIALDGSVVWEEGFGFANLERRVPMTAATVTHSGSMGKTYTATAVMQLVERGVIGLDEPISKYLPNLPITNPLGERAITVRDLLTHRSGLTSNSAGATFDVPEPLEARLKKAYASPSMESYGGTLAARWTAKVGERWQYSNTGVATLGYLVQVMNPEHLDFSDYVQRHIMDPLGMRSSQYPPVQDAAHIRPDIRARLSTGYATLGPAEIPTPTV
jgi:CubicO group peptidase (beta-lactamase class C family)